MININILNMEGNIVKSYINNNSICIKNLSLKLYNDFLNNFKLIIENEIITIDNNFIFTNDTNITLIKLPTNFLKVYLIQSNDELIINNRSLDYKQTELLKLNIDRLTDNIKYKTINDFMEELKTYINDEYCILSYPELYIYSYINYTNEISNIYSNLSFIKLLYDDYDKILNSDYNIYIIKLLSPSYFGAIKKEPYNMNIKNSYLIIRCSKQKYQCIGKITDYYIIYNKFNEPTYEFVINNNSNNIIKFFMSIKSLYFFDSEDKYIEYKNYFDKKIQRTYINL